MAGAGDEKGALIRRRLLQTGARMAFLGGEKKQGTKKGALHQNPEAREPLGPDRH